MNYLITFLCWSLVFTSLTGPAQGVLDRYVEEGLANNQQLLQESLAVKTSTLSLHEANGLYMPNVSFEAGYTLAGGGRTIDIPVGDLLNPVYSSLNQITESNQFSQIENVNEMFLPNDFHETKLRIIQPLFNTDIYYNRQISRRLVSVAEAKKAAYEKELVKEIKVGYYQYLQAVQAEQIYDSNEESLEELVRFNQRRFEENLITRDEVYRAEFQLEELRSDKASAQAQKSTAQAYFNFLLNRPHDTPIEEVEDLTFDSMNESSIDMAFQNRQELDQIRQAQEAQRAAYQMANANRFLPKVNVVGDVGYQGFGYSFGSDEDFWLVNFGLSWNLFSGFQKQKKAQKALVQWDALKSQETQLKQQIAMEVVRARTNYRASQTRLSSKDKALRAADRSFDIAKSRYQEEQILLLEYLDAQSSFLSAQLDQSIAKYELLSRHAELKRALAY